MLGTCEAAVRVEGNWPSSTAALFFARRHLLWERGMLRFGRDREHFRLGVGLFSSTGGCFSSSSRAWPGSGSSVVSLATAATDSYSSGPSLNEEHAMGLTSQYREKSLPEHVCGGALFSKAALRARKAYLAARGHPRRR